MTRFSALTPVAMAVTLGAASPAIADASHHDQQSPASQRADEHRGRCRAARHHSANTGTILGAVGGGLLGFGLGGHALGTLIGAGGGAVLGHQIGAHAHRC